VRNSIRAISAIARADFLERVRRYSFLLTLLFATLLGYAAATGRITIQLGGYRGIYTSAWILHRKKCNRPRPPDAGRANPRGDTTHQERVHAG
jgi:hypothetical protein